MLKYIGKKLIFLIILLFVISGAVFIVIRMVPGDPIYSLLGYETPAEVVEFERERLGLNDPLGIQYVRYLSDLFHGDMGTSIRSGEPVLDEILSRYPTTIVIAVVSIVTATVLGVFFGIVAAIRHNKFWDNAVMVLSMLAISTPSFFLALILLLIFSLSLGWFPSIGLTSPLHLVLPVLTLSTRELGYIARTTRSSMLDVVHQDYIRTSRAKGVPEQVVIFIHTLKNAMIPIVTTIGLKFGSLLAGAAIVETVFSINGIGSMVVEGVNFRDYPRVQGAVLMIATTFVIVNTLVDILYAVIDPRIK